MRKLYTIVLLLLISTLIWACSPTTVDEKSVVEEATSEAISATTSAVEPSSPYPGQGKAKVVKDLTAPIEASYLGKIIGDLSSPEMTGRLPGTQGNQLATDYIVNEMKAIGLVPTNFDGTDPDNGYLMPFTMTVPVQEAANEMAIQNAKGETIEILKFGTDYMHHVASPGFTRSGQITGKYHLVENHFDLKNIPEGEVALIESEDLGMYMFYSLPYGAKHLGGILVVSERQNSGEFLKPVYLADANENTANSGPLAYTITPAVFDKLMALKDQGDYQLALKTSVAIKKVTVSNVVGKLEGKKDEGFIIVGHFDHLGDNFDGRANYGALDNASGTASMLAMAKALSMEENREYTYYFAALNGEEEGLLGAYDLAKKKLWNPEHYAVINIDMLGSSDTLPIMFDATRSQSDQLVADLMTFFEAQGYQTTQSSMGFSDHAAFEQAGFKGVLLIEFDERYYHTPKDTLENSMDVQHLSEMLNLLIGWLAQ